MWGGGNAIRNRIVVKGGKGRPHSAGAPMAGARGNPNNDDDDWNYMAVGAFCCGFLILASVIAALIIGSIVLFRSVPRSALDDLCDDGNPCTCDVRETVRGCTDGICSHYDYENGGSCNDSCYTAATCQKGECLGTCRGHCEESNALDCPIISAINFTALFGWSRPTSASTSATLYRECLLSGCAYTIDLSFPNASLGHSGQTGANAFVHSIQRAFSTAGTNTTTNSSAIGGHFTNVDDMFAFGIVCMSLIHADDRDCLKAIRFDYDDHETGTNNCTNGGDECTLDIECSYMFKCTEPPSYGGKLAFPVRKKKRV